MGLAASQAMPFSWPGCFTLAGGSRKRPPHIEAVLSYWGLSSKAPKPPLDRFRSNASRTTHLQTFAYITAKAFVNLNSYQNNIRSINVFKTQYY